MRPATVAVPPEDATAVRVPPDYRLRPGDFLEFSFYRSYESVPDAYLLDVGDRIDILVEDHPDLSGEVVVRPDGRISLARLGEVVARGVTPEALQSDLQARYAKAFPNAFVSVSVGAPQVKLNEFFETLMKSAAGSARSLMVRPDGKVSLPLLGEQAVIDRTVGEVQAEIASRYRQIFRYIDVSLNVQSSAWQRIAVLGEVVRPGLYALAGPTHLMQAVALAGGFLPTAKPNSVLVVRRISDQTLSATRFDLHGLMRDGRVDFDPLLEPQDVVYVPMTTIANVNKFVDQYIRKLLPFNLGVGVFVDVGNN